VHNLPHDGRAKELGTGKSIEELVRAAGLQVRIVPGLGVADGIESARTIFPLCWFDAEKCADGIHSLRHYVYGEIEKLGVKTREPLHNWASHAADAFRYFAVGTRTPAAGQRPKPAPRRSSGSWMA
jgi:phage terminase large subunit